MSKKKDRKAGFRKVAIDIDVHRHIEANRLDFAESDNAILRRLLRIDDPAHAAPLPQARAKGGAAIDGGWTKIGRNGHQVVLPNGTELRAAYGGRRIEGRIEAGAFLVGGEAHASPSAAIIAGAAGEGAKRTNLNGWRLWEVRRPGEPGWTRLGAL